MSASMIAPALDQILHDLKMSTTTGQIAFSVFFLGLGFAPFLVAALSETYGRRSVWLAGNIWYIIWNSLCPVGSSPAMMIIGRFMSASGASVGVTVCIIPFANNIQWRFILTFSMYSSQRPYWPICTRPRTGARPWPLRVCCRTSAQPWDPS